ncbi:Adhesion and hyphal regulator 1 [Colletotrichum fructicola]|nr:Adhesion and hyphal regulator 1 [Colletotrichum fructicola]
MPAPGAVRRRGCESCRARHIKCDKGDPCGQCVSKGRSCVRATKLKFRHITVTGDGDGNRGEPQYEFSETQKWCKINSKRIRFIDETTDINSIHNDDYDSDEDIVSEEEPALPSPPKANQRRRRESSNRVAWAPFSDVGNSNLNPSGPEEGSPLPIERGIPYPLTKLPALHPHAPYDSPDSAGQASLDDLPRTVSPVPRSQLSGPIGSISSIGSNSVSEDPSLPEPQRSFHSSNFPLKDHREANLVRYFLEFIAPPFDYGDPHHRFTTVLPQHAAISPLLLNAILAIAAKSRDEEETLAFFDKPAEHYYAVALNLLSPVLIDHSAEVDDLHVTAAVLLRLYNSISELDLASLDKPLVDHSTIWEFLTSRANFTTKGSLSEAAFSGWLRLEIWRSVMQQETLEFRLDHLDLDRSLQPADDETWAWRMILHTIDIIGYCFGDETNSAVYEKLSNYAAQWMKAAPETFLPIFVENPPNEGVFPEILLINDSVVVGLQFYHLNRILLTAHNPNVPRLGKNLKLAAQTLDNEIINDIKIMCGIAESHGRSTPAHIIACMGIALAGDRFRSYPEQEALCQVFSSTAEAYAWDTALILQHLKDAWGWPEDMVAEPT